MPGLCVLGDHISKATIEAEEKSDEHPGFYIWGSQLDDIATSSLGHVRIRIKMMKEGDSTNFESRKWPGILGNEAVRQLPCLPMELPRSLPDQAPDTQQMFNYHLQLPKTTTDINGLSVVCGHTPGLVLLFRPEPGVSTRGSPPTLPPRTTPGSRSCVLSIAAATLGSQTTSTLPGQSCYQGVMFVR
jgi:hypothetical protein